MSLQPQSSGVHTFCTENLLLCQMTHLAASTHLVMAPETTLALGESRTPTHYTM